MRRSRKVAVLITVLVVVFLVNAAFCQAQGGPPSGADAVELLEKKVETANRQINEAIERAKARAEKKVDDPDEIEKIIEWLKDYTQRIADKTIEFAEKRAVIVDCKHETVIIGGEEVTIDPMRVAGY